jgi:hypothetical protein
MSRIETLWKGMTESNAWRNFAELRICGPNLWEGDNRSRQALSFVENLWQSSQLNL